jgi:hypothetical protein
MHVAVALLAALLLGPLVPSAHAHDDAPIEMSATLDGAHEVPEPTGAGTAAGTATFVLLDESKTVQFEIHYQNLSGPPIAAHFHVGAPCVAGPVAVPIQLPAGAGASGSITGTTTPLSDEVFDAVLNGGVYVNLHTALNPAGEIRGQMAFGAGKCACNSSLKKCVKAQVKQLERAERKEEGIKELLRHTKKSSCGKTKGPKKAVACCLPITPDEGILYEPVCALVTAKACTKLGGTATAGTACGPTNPCVAPATACR